MTEWKTYTLKELSKGRGEYGIGAPAVPFDKEKYTYLRITDINDDGTLNTSGMMSVDADDAEEYILEKNDIVFARTGNSTGRSYFYDGRDGELVYAGFLIRFRLDETKVNPKILKYYTHSKPYYDWVKSFDTGGTRGNINAKTYGDMPIYLPPRHIQDRIAGILSAIDDKIENNRRINTNLELQAQALYKQWFVDNRSDDWEKKKLESIIDIGSGKGLARIDFVEDGLYPILGANGQIGRTNNFLIDKKDNVLFTGRVGTLGNVFRLQQKRAWLSDNTLIITPKKKYYNYVYFFLKSSNLKDFNVGSTQPLIRQSDIKEMDILIPDYLTLEAFENKCIAMFDKINQANAEIDSLTTLRDTLLPKLMNGEIKL